MGAAADTWIRALRIPRPWAVPALLLIAGALGLGASWQHAAPMNTPRYAHTATALADGRVLVAGGYNGNGYSQTAELYHPATDTWTPAADMNAAREYHTATILADGSVLVAGGLGLNGTTASAEIYQPATDTWTPAAAMSAPRFYHTATALADGSVLVVGGFDGGLATAEIYHPATDTWTPAASPGTPHTYHTATALADGSVLVTGGYDGGGIVASAEIYHPGTDTWTPAAAMSLPRYVHTATALTDGSVLVSGGWGTGPLSAAEIYHPGTDTWTPAAAMSTPRSYHVAAALVDGSVLVAGGYGGSFLATAEIYHPGTDTWTPTSSLSTPRYAHAAAVLPGGKVLVTGGSSDGGAALSTADIFDVTSAGNWSAASDSGTDRRSHTATALADGDILVAGGYSATGLRATADLYHPGTDTWTPAAAMNTARGYHTATALADGSVLAAGGYDGSILASAELYHPSTDTWTPAAGMNAARYFHTANALPDGTVLVTGGYGNGPLASAELYHPGTDTWSAAGDMSVSRYGHTATALANGRILVAGGFGTTGFLATAEIYDPLTNAWTPAANLTTPRHVHTATALADGSVLVAGGYDGLGFTASAERYHPSTNTWTAAADMHIPRGYHTATVRADGTLLVTGGYDGNAYLASAELYHPGTDTWTLETNMSTPRGYHTATRLASGVILVVGGYDGSNNLATAELYSAPPNQAPIAVVVVPMPVVEAQPGAGFVTLDARTSSDPDGDSLGYSWRLNGTEIASGAFVIVPLPVGSWSIVLIVTDSHGLSSEQTVVVRVVDTQPPHIVGVFAPKVVEQTAAAGTPVDIPWPVAPDDYELFVAVRARTIPFGIIPDGTAGPGTFVFPLGSTTVIFDAVDSSGNATSQATTVTVRDTTPPAFFQVPGVIALAPNGPSGAVLPLTAAAVDICDAAPTVIGAGIPPGNLFPLGLTTVTWTATDVSGNQATTLTHVYVGFGTWSSAGSMAVARNDHTATLQPDGRVLVAGGVGDPGIDLASAELYDPGSNSWQTVGALATARELAAAVLLRDGRTLVTGGWHSIALATAEFFDPGTLTWSPAPPMNAARYVHTTTLLSDGRVLVMGGVGSSGFLSSAEIFDPVSSTWSPAGAPASARYYHTATALADGRVLVVGGFGGTGFLASAELYDPATNTWSPTGSLATARYFHTAASLPDGRVLVAGGDNAGSTLSSVEIYDPATGLWSPAASMSAAREEHRAVGLPDGRVLEVGATVGSTAEAYDPVSGHWAGVASLLTPRSNHAATRLADGRVLVSGGFRNGRLASAEVYPTVPHSPPTLNNIPGAVLLEATDPSGTIVGLIPPTSPDPSVTITSDAPAVFPLGTTVVVWTAKDLFGNVRTDTTTVTIEDHTAPVLSNVLQHLTVEQTDRNGTPVTLPRPDVSDNSDAAPIITGNLSGVYPLGDTTVTWIAIDASGNSSLPATTIVSVVDTTSPTIALPSLDQAYSDPAAFAHAVQIRRTIDFTGGDNGPLSPNGVDTSYSTGLSIGGVRFSSSDGYLYVRGGVDALLYGARAASPTDYAALQVLLPPGVTAVSTNLSPFHPHAGTDIQVTLSTGRVYHVPASLGFLGSFFGATSATPIDWIRFELLSSPPPGVGSFDPIALDNFSIGTGPNSAEASGPAGTAVSLSPPVVADVCDAAPVVTSDAPAAFPVGDTVVTYTVVDASGNVRTATTTVRVFDTTPPQFVNVPDSVTVEQSNRDGTPVTLPAAMAVDLADPSPIVTSTAPGVYPLGTTAVRFTATDASGNSTSVTTTVTVVDTQPPQFPSGPTAVYDAATDFSASANPNGAWSYGYKPSLPGSFALFTGADFIAAGVNQWRKPSDLIPSIVHNGTAATVYYTDGALHWAPGQVGLHPGFVGEYATCRWTAPATGPYSLACNFSDITSGYTSTDVHIFHNGTELYSGSVGSLLLGQPVASYAATVVVNAGDTIDFMVGEGLYGFGFDSTGLDARITALWGTSLTVEQTTLAGTPAASIPNLTPAVFDICDAAPQVTNNAPAVLPLGITLVQFTATDASGNSSTATTVVTVADRTPPVFGPIPGPFTIDMTDPAGTPFAVPLPGATDICDAHPIVMSDAPPSFPVGTTTVHFTATDASGNSIVAMTTVTVRDTSPPIAGMVADGLLADLAYQSSTSTLSANWSGFSDPESGIAQYEWAIGTTVGGTQIQPFVPVGTATSATATGLALKQNKIYFVTVRATNGVGMTATRSSNGVTVDTNIPVKGPVYDGPALDIDFQTSTTTISANWGPFSDTVSGIVGYEWAIGTASGGTDVQGFTPVGLSTTATNASLALSSGTKYFVTVRATNGAGLTSTKSSDGVTVDTTAPIAGTVKDGTAADIDAQSSSTSVSANWTAFSDAESGIVQYEWAIGSTPGGEQLQAFTSTGTTRAGTNSALSLVSGTRYYVTVRATNKAGLQSTAGSDGFVVDTTPPVAGQVYDGATSGVDLATQVSKTRIQANWTAFTDAESGVAKLEWSIGSTPGGSDVLAYANLSLVATSATKNGLSLVSGTTYYVTLRATNGAGLTVTATSSGVTVQ